MSKASDVISGVRISEVCRALTGIEPRRGPIPAPWRDTSDPNVALNDAKGAWFDHVTGAGGGVLDFVLSVRGGSRADALRWLAEYAGVPLDDHELTPEQRREWAREKREADQDARESRWFSTAATMLAEMALEAMGSCDQERAPMTALLRALRVSPVTEYLAWRQRCPEWTRALVQVGQRSEERVQIMVARFVQETA